MMSKKNIFDVYCNLFKVWLNYGLYLLDYSGSFECHVSLQLLKLKTVLRTCLLINPFHATGLFLHSGKNQKTSGFLMFPGQV